VLLFSFSAHAPAAEKAKQTNFVIYIKEINSSNWIFCCDFCRDLVMMAYIATVGCVAHIRFKRKIEDFFALKRKKYISETGARWQRWQDTLARP
jgi:hypothetical protein